MFILLTHTLIHLIYIKTIPTIGMAGMYALDKGIILPGPEGMRLTGAHCMFVQLYVYVVTQPLGNQPRLKRSPINYVHVQLVCVVHTQNWLTGITSF